LVIPTEGNINKGAKEHIFVRNQKNGWHPMVIPAKELMATGWMWPIM
jgi:hypothetical protein